MRKSSIKSLVGILLMLVLVCPVFLIGCGEKNPDPSKKYVVFNDGVDKDYRMDWFGTEEVHVPYDDTKVYQFSYVAYYKDNDSPTGEAGNLSTIDGNDVGAHWLEAKITEGPGTSAKNYTLKFIIDEKPDTRGEPEIRFDPRNAIEFTENERYVYRYIPDGKWHDFYPKIEVYFDDKKIELADENDNQINYCEDDKGEVHQFPYHIGIYQVDYSIGTRDYKEQDREKYKPVQITITVEIIE